MSETDPFYSEEADGMSKRTQLEEYFSQSLETDLLLRLCPDDEDTIYQIMDLLVDTCATNRKLLHIAGDDKPAEVVRSRFMKLNADHIRFVLKCLAENSNPIRNMGEKIYCEALRLIVAAWGGKPDSFRASVLRGMMHFVELYHGEFSEERLVRALGSVHPMEIYRVGRDNPAKLPGWKKYVFPIYMAYNGKGRKDALPMKF